VTGAITRLLKRAAVSPAYLRWLHDGVFALSANTARIDVTRRTLHANPPLRDALLALPGGETRGDMVIVPVRTIAQVDQDRAADLADLDGPEGGLDGPPDVPEIAFPGGQVPPGRWHVLVQQLRNCGVCLWLPAGRGLLEQLAERDLRGPLGLAGSPQPDLPARQRVGPGLDAYAERAAGQWLYVTASGPGHDGAITRSGVLVPRLVPRAFRRLGICAGGAAGTRTQDRRIMSPLL
jgi:hypothetical protein